MAIAHCADELLKRPSLLIDHTFLKPNGIQKDFEQLCQQAHEHQFFSVCIPPSWVSFCKKQLQNTNVKICSVVGFPLGYSTPQTKVFEAQELIKNGADEIDMVMNISAATSEEWKTVENDILQVSQVKQKALLKVILETSFLSKQQIQKACEVSVHTGAHFVKTSTGFSAAGANEEHIQCMRNTVGPSFGVKASGGIRNWNDFEKMIRAGANRIGASSGVEILSGGQGHGY